MSFAARKGWEAAAADFGHMQRAAFGYAHKCICICIWTYAYTYIYICMCICICLYIYIYIYLHAHFCIFCCTYIMPGFYLERACLFVVSVLSLLCVKAGRRMDMQDRHRYEASGFDAFKTSKPWGTMTWVACVVLRFSAVQGTTTLLGSWFGFFIGSFRCNQALGPGFLMRPRWVF